MGFVKQPQTLRWRRALFQIHLWVGIIIGLYVVLICASGVVLVFQSELSATGKPSLKASPGHAPPRWGQLARTALAANPGSTLSYIDMRSSNRRVVPVGLMHHGEAKVAYMDAYTDAVVRQEVTGKRHALLEWADTFHTTLVGGTAGTIGNAVGGALLLLMAGVGMVLWWPGIRTWKRALRIKWQGRWWPFSHDMHRTFGFWCCVIIAMWGATGALFMFPAQVPTLFDSSSSMSSATHAASDWKPGENVLPVEDFIERARSIHPDDKLAYVYMKLIPHGEVQVYMSPKPSVPMEILENEVVFDPGTGSILRQTSSATWSAGERLAMSLYSVHFGDFGGLPIKLVWALLGLIPVILVITSYIMWWNRVLKRKWKKLASPRVLANPTN